MISIAVGSANPVKADAVRRGFEHVWPEEIVQVEGISVESGVPDQPMDDSATRRGAIARASAVSALRPSADYAIGIEGGCAYEEDDLYAFAWVSVIRDGQTGSARTGAFRLPPEIQRLIESGMELGEADDLVFGEENSKQSTGAVGLLSGNTITRTTLYEQAVILALIPFMNPDLYPS